MGKVLSMSLQTIGNCAQVTKPRPELLFLIQDPVFFFPKRYGPAGFLFLLLLSQFFFSILQIQRSWESFCLCQGRKFMLPISNLLGQAQIKPNGLSGLLHSSGFRGGPNAEKEVCFSTGYNELLNPL